MVGQKLYLRSHPFRVEYYVLLVIVNNNFIFIRFNTDDVSIEDGISLEVISELSSYGHDITGPVKGYDRVLSFGKGQVIARGNIPKIDTGSNIYWVGTDPRSDGIAIGY